MAGKATARDFAAVRLLSLDVDGVLTDGGVYYGEDGKVSRKFNVRDGVGIKRLQAVGVEIAVVSAGTTDSIRHRADTLGIRHVFVGAGDKLTTIATLAAGLGIPLSAVAHVGDDINDLPLLKAVGLPMTVPDAIPEAKAVARYITAKKGGDAAVREVCDRIVAARGTAKTAKPAGKGKARRRKK